MPDTASHAAGTDADAVRITESAARRVAVLKEQQGNPDLMLRIAVSAGGCSGFQYGFDLDATRNDDDRVFEGHGVKVVVDEVSLDLVRGAEVDFTEDLMGAYFSLRNPNASSTCGCGSSFSL